MLIFYKLYTNDDAQFLKKLLCAAFLVIVSYMDNRTLYCASENLYTSLQEATAFCVITGIHMQENPSDYTYQHIKCMALCIQ